MYAISLFSIQGLLRLMSLRVYVHITRYFFSLRSQKAVFPPFKMAHTQFLFTYESGHEIRKHSLSPQSLARCPLPSVWQAHRTEIDSVPQ